MNVPLSAVMCTVANKSAQQNMNAFMDFLFFERF